MGVRLGGPRIGGGGEGGGGSIIKIFFELTDLWSKMFYRPKIHYTFIHYIHP